MGGVPLLLMAIAMGITYGWQPDGDGGVNYIIQVPPEQLDDVGRSGEISSVIDPEVRGHVSRVIIRVGNGPLPQETPAGLLPHDPSANRVVRASANDHSHIDSPQWLGNSPSPNLVMKPQSGDPGGLALPPTLTDAAAAAQAGNGGRDPMADLSAELAQRQRNELRQQAQSGSGTASEEAMRSALGFQGNRNTDGPYPPTNGQAANLQNNRQPPPFTGTTSNTPVARVRNGGPTTEPANPRDKTWFQLNANTPAGGPTTDPINSQTRPETFVGPPDLRNTQQPSGAATNRSWNSQQPLGSTSNFAHVPDGMSLPNNAGVPYANLTQSQQAEYLRRLQSQQANQNPAAVQTNNPGAYGRNPSEMIAVNPSLQSASQQFPGRESATTNAQEYQRLQFDPRLSQAQIGMLPFGGWSFDRYGNPIDREGRILDEQGRAVSQQRAYELTQGRASATANLEQPFNDNRFASTNARAQTGFPPAGYDERYDRIAQRETAREYDATIQRSNPAVSPTRSASTASPSDREPAEYRTTASGQRESIDDLSVAKRRPTLAAQPLFNGLLLMSIVANVYLIFWLKNLRHQFHDLVASKRAAASDISP